MNVDILLLYPPGKTLHFQSSIPTLAAYVKKEGITVDALDSPALGYGIPEILEYVERTRPKRIGVSIPFTPLAKSGLDTVISLKTRFPNTPLIVGGVHPTLCPDEFTPYANAVCTGEGEIALTEFIKNGRMPINHMVDLDCIPIPDWDIVKSQKYRLTLQTGTPAVPIQASRGCPFHCNFCSNGFLSNRQVRYKSIPNVIDEINHLTKKFNVKAVIFRDENFTLNRDRVFALCKALESSIEWWAQTRANLVDLELLNVMREAGCIGVSIGVETGNTHILRRIQKGVTLNQIEEAFNTLRKARLLTSANFIIGHPWDTPWTVYETMKFAHKLDPDYVGFALATPYPKTELRETAIEMGTITSQNWEDYYTNRVTYIPPGLEGHDLLKLKNQVESYFYTRKPSRLLKKLDKKKGLRNRLGFLKRIFTHISTKTPPRFPTSVTLGSPLYLDGNIEIGSDTYINSYSHIVSGPNTLITIGEGCAISYNVHIRGRMHNPHNINEIVEGDIIIGDNVWIGANAVIREGITIGDNAIIGANSVVTHDVPLNHVVGGVPARLLYVKDVKRNARMEATHTPDIEINYEVRTF